MTDHHDTQDMDDAPLVPELPREIATAHTDGGRRATGVRRSRRIATRPADTTYASERTRDTEEIAPLVADLTGRDVE
ncbi:hypothetical protein [Halomarina ordinaria]|uniref:Uncharacterized protein n=1 Tax=Halomarina ordinaria TaxID=3033939 RepID=A0ABD5U983_9EURY|nr:hypothetical protein [Halomarina sp. PSRA2]